MMATGPPTIVGGPSFCPRGRPHSFAGALLADDAGSSIRHPPAPQTPAPPPMPRVPLRRPFSASLLRPTAIASILASAACAHVPDTTAGPGRPQAGLRAFATQAEMAVYHRELVDAILSKPPLGSAQVHAGYPTPPGDSAPTPAPTPEPPRPRIYGSPQLLAHGDHLVVLRNGRLTTVRVASGVLEPVTTADALGAGVDTDGMLYYGLQETDEGVRVLAARTEGDITESHVAGYRVGADGRMASGGGATLRSAGRLYAGSHLTRHIGDRVVFYEPIEIPLRDPDPTAALPMLRGADGSLVTTVDPRRVYRSIYSMNWATNPRLHVVTVCGPAGAEPACAATALYAPAPRVMHVSANAIYLLTEHGEEGVLYRMPLDGSAPSALRISGSTFSPHDFRESADGYLAVHLLHGGWTEEARSQLPTPTLLRVPLSAFGDGRRAPDPRHYRPLLRLGGFYYSHFAGEWMVYGNRPHSDYMVQSGLIPATERERLGIGMLRWADTTAPAWHPTRAPAQAFASAGKDAVLALVGGGDSLSLAYLPLRPSARLLAMAAPGVEHWQGEMRGVVPHPDNTAESGLLAVTTGVRPTRYTWRSTGVAFIRYDAAGIRQIGALSLSGQPADDREVVPLFAHGRIFVLLGGELVEVAAEGDGIREIRRMALP